MRLAILADIHGNLPALEAVLDDVAKEGVGGILVAGDLTGGPQSQEVADRLRALRAWVIRGNREEYLRLLDAGTAPAQWHESEQWAALRWEYSRLDRATLAWVATLPGPHVFAPDRVPPIRVVHGSPSSAREALFPQQEHVLQWFRRAGFTEAELAPGRLTGVLASLDEPVLVCGHTHIAWALERDGKLVLNPGSVGAPLNGDVRAQYALLEWRSGRWQAVHRALSYDLAQVRRAFEESGYLAHCGAYARAWLTGIETGRYVWGVFLRHLRRSAAEMGDAQRQMATASAWDRAVASFDWDRYAF
jgi:predicted phosphodiesterase